MPDLFGQNVKIGVDFEIPFTSNDDFVRALKTDGNQYKTFNWGQLQQ